jgi:hypothetical protein
MATADAANAGRMAEPTATTTEGTGVGGARSKAGSGDCRRGCESKDDFA